MERLLKTSEIDQNEKIHQFVLKIERVALSEAGIPLPPLINESKANKEHSNHVAELQKEIAALTEQLECAAVRERILNESAAAETNQADGGEELVERLVDDDDVVTTHAAELEATIKSIQCEKESLQCELRDARALIESYELFNLRADETRTQVSTEMEVLKAELDELRRVKQTMSEDVNMIRDNVERIDVVDHQLNAHDKQIADLEMELQQSVSEHVRQNNQLMTLRAELARKEEELQQHKEEIEVNKRLLRIRTDLISTMQSEQDVTMKQLTVRQMREAMMAEEVQNLFSTLGMKDVEVARQRETIVQLELEMHVRQRESSEAEARAESLRRENATLKRKFNDVFSCRNLNVRGEI